MIELKVMRRMLLRGILLAPLATALAWFIAGPSVGLGVLVGIALALGNLYLAARIIGGIAENAPHLMLPGALAAFMIGMFALVLIAMPLRSLQGWDAAAAGIALIATHLLLVMWEAATHLLKMPEEDQSQSVSRSAALRS